MKKNFTAIMSIFAVIFVVSVIPTASLAQTPQLNPPPATLPSVTYYTATTHYTITNSEWLLFFENVIDNQTLVKYDWSQNATQQLIVFDLSYTGLNYYGADLVAALAKYGFPDVQNMTKAFKDVANQPSQISGYSNIQALNGGAYPGFSWSKPKVQSPIEAYYEVGSIIGILAAMFVLYFVFNRKR